MPSPGSLSRRTEPPLWAPCRARSRGRGPIPALRLRGEERLERPLPRLGVHALAVVGDRDDGVRAGGLAFAWDALVAAAIRLARGSVVETVIVSEPPVGIASRALRARLTSVCSIRSGSTLASAGCGAGIDDQLDPLADQVPEQRRRRRDEIVEVDDLRLERLLAGKGKQLLRQRGSLLGGAADLLGLVVRPGARLEPGEEQLAVALDRREHVVEVVGDTSGEPADRLELLRVVQRLAQPVALGLGILPVGDVEPEAQHVRLAVFVGTRNVSSCTQTTRPSGVMQRYSSRYDSPVSRMAAASASTRSRSSGWTIVASNSAFASQCSAG